MKLKDRKSRFTREALKLPEREINEMKQTVSCFYWKAEKRLSEGI